MRMFFASFLLRFKDTDGLIAALDMMERANANVLDKPDNLRKAKLKVAKELIRRGVVFWEGN